MPTAIAPDGCLLHYDRTGAGPPVVLIPGLGGDGRFWAPVAARLATGFDLVAIDHRGAGRSARPHGPYTIGTIARDVLAVMDDAGLADAHLVGHSTGGAVVQAIALDAPDRARSLVISGSWARPDARFRATFEARAAMLDAGLAGPYQQLTHVFGYDPAWIDAHAAELEAAVAAAAETLAPLSVTAARVRMLLGFDCAADLARVRHRTLVVSARGDILVPPHHADHLSSLLPHAEVAMLDGAHFHPRTDPAPFADRVAAFLMASPSPDVSHPHP